MKKLAFIVFCLLLIIVLFPPAPANAATSKSQTKDVYFASGAIVSPDGWEWQNPLPQGNALRGIWGSSANDVFVVGDGGTIMHYDGSRWNSMASGTTSIFSGIWGSSPTDVKGW